MFLPYSAYILIPLCFITYGPLFSFADDIPNWPTLVIPSLACSVTSLFPSDTAFKILLAVATAFFVFDASGKNLLPSSARDLLRKVFCKESSARHLTRDIFCEQCHLHFIPVEAYVYSSAAVLTATTYNIAYMDFGESKMHRKVLNDFLLVI